jgi:hypothetical protein
VPRSFRAGVVALAVGVLAACSHPPGTMAAHPSALPLDRVGTEPTELRSPPIGAGDRPALLSTTDDVIVAGGTEPAAGSGRTTISRSAVRYRRRDQTVSVLPALPTGVLVEFGAAVNDVPYLIGARCTTPRPVDRDAQCRRPVVLTLVDAGHRWREIGDAGTVLAGRRVATVVPRDGRLVITTTDDPEIAYRTLDPETRSWSEIGRPPGSDGLDLRYCTTARATIAYAPITSMHRAVPAQRRTLVRSSSGYAAWVRSGLRWSDRIDLPLAPDPGAADGGRQLCGRATLLLTARRRGITLTVDDDGRPAATAIAAPAPFVVATHGSLPHVGVTGDRGLVRPGAADGTEVTRTAMALPADPPLQAASSGEWTDLLEPAADGRRVVLSFRMPT